MINWKCNICDVGFEELAEDADGFSVCPICGEGSSIVKADLCDCGKPKEVEYPLCDDCRNKFYKKINSFADGLEDSEVQFLKDILTDGMYEHEWHKLKFR